jgi:glycosyltransferase involved in cell wall biosynthesis
MSKISVVVPALDEAARIESTVAQLRAALGRDAQIIVVDDGSTDDTASRADRAGADAVVRLPENRGKGAAVRAGVARATGETLVFTDADLAYPPDQIERLVAEVAGGTGMAAGTRRHGDTVTLVRAGLLRDVGGRVFNLLVRRALATTHSDTQCGLKAFDAATAKVLFGCSEVDGFAFDVELFKLADHFGVRVVEVPVTIANTTTTTVKVRRDAVRMLRDLRRIRRRVGDGTYDRRREALERSAGRTSDA